MTLYIIGLVALRVLCTAVFFLGLYKIVVLVHGKMKAHHTTGENRGIIILKERFASGEIDEEKYRAMSSVLTN
ncbi:MAG: hypothetical protein JEY91_15975 [Spirochaetaceae bacterium]|nr:hypothetical protein [Spirochaetaceae bacterium]